MNASDGAVQWPGGRNRILPAWRNRFLALPKRRACQGRQHFLPPAMGSAGLLSRTTPGLAKKLTQCWPKPQARAPRSSSRQREPSGVGIRDTSPTRTASCGKSPGTRPSKLQRTEAFEFPSSQVPSGTGTSACRSLSFETSTGRSACATWSNPLWKNCGARRCRVACSKE